MASFGHSNPLALTSIHTTVLKLYTTLTTYKTVVIELVIESSSTYLKVPAAEQQINLLVLARLQVL